MKPPRPWLIALLVTVVIAVVAILYQTVFHRVPEQCRPVRELLDFNKSQAARIAEKSGNDAADILPSAAEQAGYVAWADGLSDRAGKVTDPALAQHSVELATLANEFAGKLSQLSAQTRAQAPGAAVPPVAYELSVLNDRITDELAQLTKACTR